MKRLFIIFLFILKLTNGQNVTSVCSTNIDCKHGICYNSTIGYQCQCERGWIHSKSDPKICDYQQKSKLAVFLLSFFLGGFGGDWYYLSMGNGAYIAAGIFKMLTLGGMGIWWLVDWIRILTNSFLDGQGNSLLEWTP